MCESRVKVLLNPSPQERQDLTDGVVLYFSEKNMFPNPMFHFSAIGRVYSKSIWEIEVVMNVAHYFFGAEDLCLSRVTEEYFFKQLKEHHREHLDWLLFHPEVLRGEYLP